MGNIIRNVWQARTDRYSEERGIVMPPKAEMSYLGGSITAQGRRFSQ